MGRAPKLILHEGNQMKVLPTAGHTVKRIADVFKRSRKAIMNFLRHQEKYGTKKSSGRPSKLNDREKRGILRTTSNNTISITEIRGTCSIDATESTAWRILDKPFSAMGLVDLAFVSTKMNSVECVINRSGSCTDN
uniref:HTH_Tnp_Tc3_1 domain-containing protein n=1 Tax=Heterorhabditis bacteriophora TaxID=37862 RepID=A0A1I7XGV5_HETBA